MCGIRGSPDPLGDIRGVLAAPVRLDAAVFYVNLRICVRVLQTLLAAADCQIFYHAPALILISAVPQHTGGQENARPPSGLRCRRADHRWAPEDCPAAGSAQGAGDTLAGLKNTSVNPCTECVRWLADVVCLLG
jgi:hypothetical protein